MTSCSSSPRSSNQEPEYWIAGVGMTRTTTDASTGGSVGAPCLSTYSEPARKTACVMDADSADSVVSASTVSKTYAPSASSRALMTSSLSAGGGPLSGTVVIVYDA